MTDPDQLWVTQSKTGDRAAFGKLAERYYEMVYGIAFGIISQREMARDITQEVFLKVFKEIVRFEGKSKFSTWLYRIAVNMSIDEYRRRKPQESLDASQSSDEDMPPLVIEDPRPGPRDEAHQADLSRLMRQALERLSPEHRVVLVMREWQGLSYEEIAETLGIEMGTVMSRIFYGRKKLGEILRPTLKVPE